MRRQLAIGLAIVGIAALATIGSARAAPLLQATDTDTPTITPTATVTGIPFGYATQQTRAPGPDDFACPATPPAGWLTITPAPAWRILCGQCLASDGSWLVAATATPIPTATVYRTATLGPSPTAGPSLTPTRTPTPTATRTPTVTATPTKSQQDVAYIPPVAQWLGVSPGGGVQNSYTTPIDMGSGNTAQVLGGTTGITWSVACHVAGSDSVKIQLCSSATGTSCAGTPRLEFTCGALEGRDRSFSGRQVATGNDGPNRYLLLRVVTTGASGQWGVYSAALDHVYVQWAIPSATPTPGATPTISPSYCSSVDGGQESDFEYSGIIFGDAQCLDIGPIAGFDLLGIHWPGIPWIAHLCLQAVTLGTLTIFGTSIALDVLVIIFGVVLIIRLLTQ